jgi:hypothetical protein
VAGEEDVDARLSRLVVGRLLPLARHERVDAVLARLVHEVRAAAGDDDHVLDALRPEVEYLHGATAGVERRQPVPEFFDRVRVGRAGSLPDVRRPLAPERLDDVQREVFTEARGVAVLGVGIQREVGRVQREVVLDERPHAVVLLARHAVDAAPRDPVVDDDDVRAGPGRGLERREDAVDGERGAVDGPVLRTDLETVDRRVDRVELFDVEFRVQSLGELPEVHTRDWEGGRFVSPGP